MFALRSINKSSTSVASKAFNKPAVALTRSSYSTNSKYLGGKNSTRKFQHLKVAKKTEESKSIRDFIRREIEVKSEQLNHSSMFSVVTVCHKNSDTSHPLVMFQNRDGYRYFFGKVPEGTQRIINQNKLRLLKMEGLFLTGTIKSWSEIGGLPGLFLTITDATKKGIDLFTSSSRIMSFVVATWRYFVFRKGAQIGIFNTDGDKLIDCKSFSVKPIQIQSSIQAQELDENKVASLLRPLRKLTSSMFPLDTSKVNSMDPESYKSDPSEGDIHTHVKLPKLAELDDVQSQPSVSYLIRPLPIRGRFDAVAAKNLKIERGAKYRELSIGNPVYNTEGTLIQPEQVIGPSKSFKKLLIIDIPDRSYYQNTVNNESFFQKSEELGEEEIGLVYHFIGDDIDLDLNEYSKFISKFPADCFHVLSHRTLSDNTLSFHTFALNTLMLKSIQNNQFNLPHTDEYQPLEHENKSIFKLHSTQKFDIDTEGITYEDSYVNRNNWSTYFDSVVIPAGLGDSSTKEDIIYSPPLSLAPSPSAKTMKDHVQIVTLGTGSAIPSLQRNVVSSLVRVPYKENGSIKFRSILLDGGENTLASILRNYGHNNREQLIQIFDELCFIHLSHLHADHHLGLISVINQWFKFHKNDDKKLYLVTPWQYNNFVNEWYEIEAEANSEIDINRVVYISCQDFLKEQDRIGQLSQMSLEKFEHEYDCNENSCVLRDPLLPRDTKNIEDLYRNLGLKSVNTCKAVHCFWAYSISMTFDLDGYETFKVSYSGDTRPNVKFVEIGYNSDLLIHECSLGDDLIEEAISRKHSSMIEAVRMSQLMNCPKVILTHFSSRYSKSPNLFQNLDKLDQRAEEMGMYLRNSGLTYNIFGYKSYIPIINSLQDIDICFGFDMMTIRYNELNEQMQKHDLIEKIFDQSEQSLVKAEKSMKRMVEVSEKKKLERLLRNKKRRVSSDEED